MERGPAERVNDEARVVGDAGNADLDDFLIATDIDVDSRQAQLRIMGNIVERELAAIPRIEPDEKSIVICCWSSKSVLKIGICIYWFWSLISLVNNSHVVFPGLFFFPFLAIMLALVATALNSYHLLTPLLMMIAFEFLYTTVEFFFLINFKNHGPNDKVNQFVSEHWPNKANQLITDVQRYELSMFYILVKLIYSIAMALFVGQEITRFRVNEELTEKRNQLLRRRDWIRDQQYRMCVNDRPVDHQGYFMERGMPPLPSYDSVAVLGTPQHGTPPPSYSAIERAAQISSPKDGTDASTAMSPSSFLHTP